MYIQTDTYIDDVFLEFSWCMDTYQISRTIFCDPILNLRWWATRHRFIDFAPLPPATAGQVAEDSRDVRREGGLLQWWRCSCPTWTWIASHRRSLTMFDNVRTLWWWVHHQKIEKPQGWLLKLDIAYYILYRHISPLTNHLLSGIIPGDLWPTPVSGSVDTRLSCKHWTGRCVHHTGALESQLF